MTNIPEKHKYITFPVELIKDAFDDIGSVCNNALCYAIYVKYSECEDLHETCDFLGIEPNASYIESIVTDGKGIYEKYRTNGTCPMVSIGSAAIFNYLVNPKTDFEISVFCAMCAAKSIIGSKPYYPKCTTDYFIARMFGFRSVNEFMASEPKPEYYQKYFSTKEQVRYQLTKKLIKGVLVEHCYLKYYATKMRGFAISFKMDLEDLVYEIELKKHNKQWSKSQREQAEAKALKRVKEDMQLPRLQNNLKNSTNNDDHF